MKIVRNVTELTIFKVIKIDLLSKKNPIILMLIIKLQQKKFNRNLQLLIERRSVRIRKE